MSSTTSTTTTDANVQFDGRIVDLVLINSMYPGQLVLDDSQLHSHIVINENVTTQYCLPISGIFIVDKILEIYIELPIQYPNCQFTVHCRIIDGSFNKILQKRLNNEVSSLFRDSKETNLIEIIQTIIQKWNDLNLNEFTVNTNHSINNSNTSTDQLTDKSIIIYVKINYFL